VKEEGHVLGIWNVRSLYRSGLATAEAVEVIRYRLYIVGVHVVRWEKEGTEKQ